MPTTIRKPAPRHDKIDMVAGILMLGAFLCVGAGVLLLVFEII